MNELEKKLNNKPFIYCQRIIREWEITSEKEAKTIIKLYEQAKKTNIERVFRDMEYTIELYRGAIFEAKLNNNRNKLKSLTHSVVMFELECKQISKSYKILYKKFI